MLMREGLWFQRQYDSVVDARGVKRRLRWGFEWNRRYRTSKSTAANTVG